MERVWRGTEEGAQRACRKMGPSARLQLPQPPLNRPGALVAAEREGAEVAKAAEPQRPVAATAAPPTRPPTHPPRKGRAKDPAPTETAPTATQPPNRPGALVVAEREGAEVVEAAEPQRPVVVPVVAVVALAVVVAAVLVQHAVEQLRMGNLFFVKEEEGRT